MITLIIGTPGSGKSRKAEDIIETVSGGAEKIYVATMIPFGEDGKKRIERHRNMRKGKNFQTVECPVGIDNAASKISDIENKYVLLECISNLVGNEQHSELNKDLGYEELLNKIVSEVLFLGDKCRHLVVVSNMFPADDPEYDEDTKLYVRLTLDVNEKLKKEADEIYELTEGEWNYFERH